MMLRFCCTLLLVALPASAAEVVVPAGGNAFRTAPTPGGPRGDGVLELSAAGETFAIFFRVDRPGPLDLSVVARAPSKSARLIARVGDKAWTVPVEGTEFAPHKFGQVQIPRAGYVRVEIERDKLGGTAEVRDLVVSSDTQGLVVNRVANNDGNMFYWGRRGPSVHLSYETPKNVSLRYAHTEITVAKGDDVIGSYFMANGFAEGYFGMQVNGPEERRVLFSVWSPFSTDNPRDIPEDQRVKCLGSGPEVRIGEFGNEGSGGQSFLVYPWKGDVTYGFLTEVRPDGADHTVYTSWFRERAESNNAHWRLIASFRRPKTNTHLKGYHSFLENFDPSTGHLTRGARYGRTSVCDVDGKWYECVRARFSVDATGGGRHRLDFLGGARGESFFLRNCGFFAETGTPGEQFSRQPSTGDKLTIDFDSLPRPPRNE
jgi:hypothetical protein